MMIALRRLAAVALLVLAGAPARAQTPSWQIEPGTLPPPAQQPGNVTIVPRSGGSEEPRPGAAPGQGQLSLTASMTEDGQIIDQGLIWRVFRDKPGPDGKPRLVSTVRDATPRVTLEPGDYVVNVAYGRANLTRRISVAGEKPAEERFVLNAGGLRVAFVLPGTDAMADRATGYDVFSDERDQSGQRKLIVSGVRPGLILRLNAGLYNIVSTYGDANATARADVTVEAGKLTEATLTHQAAKITLKLVTRPGGDAISDTQWIITTPQGEMVKESVGALPTHVLAPGAYVATARNAGQAFQRQFSVQQGQAAQVEVLRR
ncbi:MAG: hypothetical protein NW223_04420 [Hyphomicrobiaceae bacterium]|nr:hypothetical protein [Hyphomicrobiaceae bacterium]